LLCIQSHFPVHLMARRSNAAVLELTLEEHYNEVRSSLLSLAKSVWGGGRKSDADQTQSCLGCALLACLAVSSKFGNLLDSILLQPSLSEHCFSLQPPSHSGPLNNWYLPPESWLEVCPVCPHNCTTAHCSYYCLVRMV
jgi:hypothetical protein